MKIIKSLNNSGTPTMSETQFYYLWERFAMSDILEELPDDVEKFCEEHEITVDYYIEEFM